MSPAPDGTPLTIRCLDCKAEWDPDMEPLACTCGGRWQLKVGEDGPWEDAAVI